VRKAVKWNSPFYGMEGQGWFLNFHCFTKYVKVAFFRGTSLRPVPPGESKHKGVRYLDIHEDDQLDEELVASWIRQASELPGLSRSADKDLHRQSPVFGWPKKQEEQKRETSLRPGHRGSRPQRSR
jgi:hypothetical protein